MYFDPETARGSVDCGRCSRVWFRYCMGEVCTSVLFICKVKGEIIVDHVTPPHGKENGCSIPDDSERTLTVALPGLLADNHSSTAALDAFSTVFEPPPCCCKNRQTDSRTSPNALPRYSGMLTRGNNSHCS